MKLFVLIPLLVLAWYKYLTTGYGGTLALLALLGASGFMALGVRKDLRRAAAANNVVAAAATFSALSEGDRARVHSRAVEIVRRSGWTGSRDPSFQGNAERYGWYALAMGELSIPPACIIKSWNVVGNPFVAISDNDSNIESAVTLARRAGYDVVLSRAGNG